MPGKSYTRRQAKWIKETLIAHFQQLGPSFCTHIQVVACDMAGPYREVARHCFPRAQPVTDRFHVEKLLNQVLGYGAEKKPAIEPICHGFQAT